MRYIIITLSCGYCCSEEEHCLMFPKETADENITEYAHELLNNYAEKYEDFAEDDFEDMQAFFENCSCDWIEVFEGDKDFNYRIEEFSMA